MTKIAQAPTRADWSGQVDALTARLDQSTDPFEREMLEATRLLALSERDQAWMREQQ